MEEICPDRTQAERRPSSPSPDMWVRLTRTLRPFRAPSGPGRAARHSAVSTRSPAYRSVRDLGRGLDVDLLVLHGPVAAMAAPARRRCRRHRRHRLTAWKAVRFRNPVDLLPLDRPGRLRLGFDGWHLVHVGERIGAARAAFAPCSRASFDFGTIWRTISSASIATLACALSRFATSAGLSPFSG
jgi:hypothetical protein